MRELETLTIWTTAEGAQIPITQMETSHLFNAMKMCFNHLANAHGGRPVWFNHQYCDYEETAASEPQKLARTIIAMLGELDRRKDLPIKYHAPLTAIKEQVYGRTEMLTGDSEGPPGELSA